MNEGILSIRGHHLLCAPRFVGCGYSPNFVRNMGAVLSRLRAGRAPARLVDGPDAICRACPHLIEGACAIDGAGSERTRVLQDHHVLAGLGLEVGSVIPWSQVEKMARGSPIEVGFVCGACQWSEVCWGSGDRGQGSKALCATADGA